MQTKSNKPEVFISYAWGDKNDVKNEKNSVFNLIHNGLKNRDFNVIYDAKDLPYKGKISSFMSRLGKADFIVLILGDKYLKSEFCMEEVLHIFDNSKFHERVFPVVLESANLFDTNKLPEYVNYWANKTKEVEEAMKEIASPRYAGTNLQKKLEKYDKIGSIISKFRLEIGDMNVIKADLHGNVDFNVLFDSIQVAMDNRSERNEMPNFALEVADWHENEEDAWKTLQMPKTISISKLRLQFQNLNRAIESDKLVAEKEQEELELTKSQKVVEQAYQFLYQRVKNRMLAKRNKAHELLIHGNAQKAKQIYKELLEESPNDIYYNNMIMRCERTLEGKSETNTHKGGVAASGQKEISEPKDYSKLLKIMAAIVVVVLLAIPTVQQWNKYRAETSLKQANKLKINGLYRKAIANYQQVLDIQPKHKLALKALASCQDSVNKQDYQVAIEKAKSFLATAQGDTSLVKARKMFEKANLLCRNKATNESNMELINSKIDPLFNSYIEYGNIFMGADDGLPNAKFYFEQAVFLKPNDEVAKSLLDEVNKRIDKQK